MKIIAPTMPNPNASTSCQAGNASTARLQALEEVAEAAKVYVEWLGGRYHLTGNREGARLIDALSRLRNGEPE